MTRTIWFYPKTGVMSEEQAKSWGFASVQISPSHLFLFR
eukprot:CAMPEP_0197659862 /NCGR_PEP_ID=MMETSP1338-20131121/49471_1 /TAXON_ID=43686 ORGANISM="Pelagodinium beii, Strain RCC1491" /NCGR_SAMPLE_ID=MMETSP1338 /ASSEMBLY_ACC=CAM_ASM_000754 /LENGTH=38 /DNA_ID= /DNA_START= /DNA_END= /DNA_ORIENTATION=